MNETYEEQLNQIQKRIDNLTKAIQDYFGIKQFTKELLEYITPDEDMTTKRIHKDEVKEFKEKAKELGIL